MKTKRHILIMALAAVLSATALSISARNTVVPKMYMFGFAASFNDSIVYLTEIQAVDSVWIDTKNSFLQGRENYSYQLRNYLANKLNLPHRTCVVFYNQDRQKLEKKYLKFKALYTTKAKQNYEIRHINENDFHFRAVNLGYEEITDAQAKAEKKAAKEAAKAKKKAEKAKKKAAKAAKKARKKKS